MNEVPISNLATAIKKLHEYQLLVLEMNSNEIVQEDTIMWIKYYLKKMGKIMSGVELGKIPTDEDIDVIKHSSWEVMTHVSDIAKSDLLTRDNIRV